MGGPKSTFWRSVRHLRTFGWAGCEEAIVIQYIGIGLICHSESKNLQERVGRMMTIWMRQWEDIALCREEYSDLG